MKKTILICMLAIIATSVDAQEIYKKVKIWFDNKSANDLAKTGVDLTEGELRNHVWFISEFSTKELNKIQQAGFRTDVLIDDVTAFYKTQNAASALLRIPPQTDCGTFSPQYPVPAHFYLGDMGGFFTYDQLLNILDSMALLYPNLITQKQLIDTTHTIEGRPIYYLKISDNPGIDENEPKVLYTAVHHAREPESLSQLIYYMWYLLENYASDTTVRNLVDNTEMYFIPCINPDGYIYNQTTDPAGGGMWRKNRRDNLDGEFGVDLNRNYDYQWGYDDSGSSPATVDDTYRGAFPFSEPETQAVRNFSNAHHFLLCLNYHTFGDHLVQPYGYVAGLFPPDSTQYSLYGHSIAQYNHYHVGTPNTTVNYLVNGGSDDWMYGEQVSKPKIFSWTPEVGLGDDGFWPLMNRIIPLANENVYPNLMLAKLAGRYGRAEHSENHFVSQLNSEFVFDFRLLGLDTTGNFTVSLTPLSPSISSVGSPVIFSGLNLIQAAHDSIAVILNPSVADGDPVEYLVSVDNGLYLNTDTIKQIYGTSVVALADNGSTTAAWNGATAWDVTTEDYVSPNTSITDSPFSDYPSNDNSSITLSNPINLSGVADAQLSFFTKWNTEKGFDYVQVLASADNGNTWTALCGKYTVTGTASEAPGEPVYDGNQSDWVREEISLNDYTGQSILIRFTIISDGFQEYDGFYFDDLQVETVSSTSGIANATSSFYLSPAFPNPATKSSDVNFSKMNPGSVFVLYNSFGQLVWTKKISETNGTIHIPTEYFENGIYSYFVQTNEGMKSRVLKVVISK